MAQNAVQEERRVARIAVGHGAGSSEELNKRGRSIMKRIKEPQK